MAEELEEVKRERNELTKDKEGLIHENEQLGSALYQSQQDLGVYIRKETNRKDVSTQTCPVLITSVSIEKIGETVEEPKKPKSIIPNMDHLRMDLLTRARPMDNNEFLPTVDRGPRLLTLSNTTPASNQRNYRRRVLARLPSPPTMAFKWKVRQVLNLLKLRACDYDKLMFKIFIRAINDEDVRSSYYYFQNIDVSEMDIDDYGLDFHSLYNLVDKYCKWSEDADPKMRVKTCFGIFERKLSEMDAGRQQHVHHYGQGCDWELPALTRIERFFYSFQCAVCVCQPGWMCDGRMLLKVIGTAKNNVKVGCSHPLVKEEGQDPPMSATTTEEPNCVPLPPAIWEEDGQE